MISWTVVTLQKVNTVALLCWTLDCSLYCIPAVNSVWEYFHRFSSFPKYHLLQRWWSYPEENGTKVPKLQVPKKPKQTKQNAICLCPLRPFHMTSHIHEGSISLCSFSPCGNAIHCQLIDLNLLTFLCYIFYITVND